MRVILVAAALAVAGCGDSKERSAKTEKADQGASVSIAIDDDAPHGGAVAVAADSDTGKFEISLPGGIAAKVAMPGGMPGSKFDIDGVGLYPGAKLGSINVKAPGRGETATVDIGFTAPADAAAVADWYQQQFAEKHVAVSRQGDMLAGRTADGDDFTLALTPAARGSAGVLKIRDADKG